MKVSEQPGVRRGKRRYNADANSNMVHLLIGRDGGSYNRN
jgi:hypothetical protein